MTLHNCTICGLLWTCLAEAQACCRPGVAEYEKGGGPAGVRTDGWTASALPRRYSSVAYVYDRIDFVKALKTIKNRRAWWRVAEELCTQKTTLDKLMKGDKVWMSGAMYEALIGKFGSPVPGVRYWPPTLSAPVGVEDLGEIE